MYKIDAYIVECMVEEYRDGWRCIVRLFRALPSLTRPATSVQYSVPALFANASAAERAAYVWARRLVETNRESIELALADAELDEATAAHP